MVQTVADVTSGLAGYDVWGVGSKWDGVSKLVDGTEATSQAVNTNAATTAHRVVVWQKALSLGTHTIKLTNVGTTGHPRIDVDAIMLTFGATTSPAR